MKANLPENELDRLAALDRYGSLNAIPKWRFDRLTRLAARLFSAPLAMVTLLDAERSVIKSIYGADASEGPREQSFCAHAILCDDLLVVGNTTQDSRFSDLHVVTNPPFVRFYAGAVLKTRDGFPLGTLCVADGVPRMEIDPGHLDDLRDLAAEVMELLELDRSKSQILAMQARLDEQRRELAESRELWRKTDQRAMLALEAGRMGYWERDAHTGLVTISAGLSVLLGLEPRDHQLSMNEWLQSVHEEDRATVLETIDRVGRTQENYLLKYRTRTPEGEERWISSSGVYRLDEAGNFKGAQGVAWDTTAIELADRQLKISEELFRGLSESAPVGVFRADMEGRMTYANPRTAEILGRPADALLGRGWFQYVHPEDQIRMNKSIASATAQLAAGDNEFRVVLADGAVRRVQARTSILFDGNGLPLGKIGTMDDISQRHQSIHDLKHAKEAAEVANRTKDMFLANVSHELRTPLNGVLGMTDMLLDTGLAGGQLEMAETIRESGRSLLTLVNDMLDVGRIEAGKIQIERLPFRLPAIIQQIVSLMEPEAKRKNLTVRAGYPFHLPVSYLGDAQRIEQILLNFLSNAVKFSLAGEISILVSGESVPDGAGGNGSDAIEITFSVTDNGPGIEPQAQKKLFQPFSQVDGSSTRRNSGVGLGLAISKRLAELMGGAVGLVSAPGRGSTFWLRLPLTPTSQTEIPTAESGPVAASGAGRILLAEDNVINQKVTLAALGKLGWQADVASDGLIALDLFCRNEYALVFMDCHMPGMDGFEVTRAIRQRERGQSRPAVPVVALTASAMSGDRERCLAAGMNDYLAKPFRLEELRRVLSRWSLTPGVS